jgi:uncharacterized lipoprotein YddW (UPF0748 family)
MRQIISLKVLMAFLMLSAYVDMQSWAAEPELRAVWTHLQFDADPAKGRTEVREYVERMARANFNAILPWVTSDYLVALTDETYQKVTPNAKWDALGELIKDSQEKGLQVHIWYSFTSYKRPQSPEFNPTLHGSPAWASVQIDELNTDGTTEGEVPKRMANLCPLHPGGRDWELELIKRAVERYPSLSGIHIEEPGYTGDGCCVCDLCRKLYQQIYGLKGLPDVNGQQAEDLKCLGTTEFMRQLRKWMSGRKPRMLLSANGAYAWLPDRRSGRDWKRWAEFKWLDFYVPQIYTSDLSAFRDHAQTTVSDLSKNCPVAAGLAVNWGQKGQNSIETIIREITIARQVGVKGIVIYNGQVLTDEHLKALKSGPFSESVSLPKLEN